MSTFSMFRRPASIALALTASIAIVSCNDKTTPAAVNSVTLTTTPAVSTTSPLTVGSTTQAKAVVTATAGTATTVTYTSSVPTVATVDANGLIKAVAPGTTVVKATSTADTSKSAQVTITVVAASTTPTVTAVAVTLNPASVAVGGTSQATASVTGTNSPAQTVTWTSTNTAVATVSATGVVTALTPGTTDIVATSTVDSTKNGKATLTVTAVVGTRPAVRINFAPSGSTVATYTTNSGAAYTATSMTGWITEASAGTATPVALDMTANTRPSGAPIVLATAEPAQLTQINMQCGVVPSGNTCATGTLTSGAFEYKMADGVYNVTVSVGDASASTNANNLNSSHTINVEGTNIIKNFVPTSAKIFEKATKQVTVTGGVMTMDAKGGQNTKVNYIILEPVN